MSYLMTQVVACGAVAYILGLIVGFASIWVASMIRGLRGTAESSEMH